MGDLQIFGGGVFITLWLVLFFGYSAYALRKGYQPKAPITKLAAARGAPLGRNAPIA